MLWGIGGVCHVSFLHVVKSIVLLLKTGTAIFILICGFSEDLIDSIVNFFLICAIPCVSSSSRPALMTCVFLCILEMPIWRELTHL